MIRLENLDSACIETCLVGHALDGMCVGLVMTNPAGKVAWMNRAARRILDLPGKEEAYGQPLTAVLRDPQLTDFWHRSLAVEGTLLGEVTIHEPRTAELKVNAARCEDETGACTGRVLLFCDVTAEKSLQVQLSREATDRLMGMADRFHEGKGPVGGLTPQELRIMRLVGRGRGNVEIASELEVSPSTIRSHLKAIYRKTGLSSRSEGVRFAIQNGLD